MKHLILISVIILLRGCAEFLEIEPEHPPTYNWMGDGQGSYSKLQTDRYECAQEAAGDDEIVYVFVFDFDLLALTSFAVRCACVL